MSDFCKNESCPPSERLLAFQNGDIATLEGRAIRFHLAECEFCQAEVDFYGHYPPCDVSVETAKMPEPLFQLAEALLSTGENYSKSSLRREVDRVSENES